METEISHELTRVFTNLQKIVSNGGLVHDRGNIVLLCQVCETLENNATKARETIALKQAMDELNIKKSIIITRNEATDIVEDKKNIKVISFWKWISS